MSLSEDEIIIIIIIIHLDWDIIFEWIWSLFGWKTANIKIKNKIVYQEL